MPIDPEKYKQDSRSPQELAKAILDHVVTPRTARAASLTFREQLWMDYQTPVQMEHPVLSKHGSPLLLALKNLEEALPLHAHRKRVLRHALQVIDAYRKESGDLRDAAVIRANRAAANPDGLPAPAFHRQDAEAIETYMVEISNINSIDKLTRVLAHKLGITLAEPGRSK